MRKWLCLTVIAILLLYRSDKAYTEEIIKDIVKIVDGNSVFAFDLYKKLIADANNLEKNHGNLFISPYSISTALAMTYAGARGDTEKQMADTLHFTLAQDNLHKAFGELEAILKESGQKGDFDLLISNRLWPQKDYHFLESYIHLIEDNYKSRLLSVDYIEDPEEARQTINAAIEKDTKNKIRELIKKPHITKLTRLVLTNAIYFKGDWVSQFDKASTRKRDFFPGINTAIKVDIMYQKSTFLYGQTDSLQIVELPYKGKELSMVVLLPRNKNGLKELEKELVLENLTLWRKQMRNMEIEILLPKFKMICDYELATTLVKMGMLDAFGVDDRIADFSGMTGNKELFISQVLHKAYIDVNEEGSEASAATAVVMSKRVAIVPLPVFRADHPFVFLIKDTKTGSILFMGRVNDPTQE